MLVIKICKTISNLLLRLLKFTLPDTQCLTPPLGIPLTPIFILKTRPNPVNSKD
jgi:hypothetical protein